MKLIIGLGNPGDKYSKTRHNAGFMAVDYLASKLGLAWHADKALNAAIAKGIDTILVKPDTFMNNSGQAVTKVANYYKLTPSGDDYGDDILVIHDDLDLPLGTWRKAYDSTSGGQKGVQSIIDHLHSKKFTRLKLGIKTEDLNRIRLGFFKTTAAKFVLSRLPASELKQLEDAYKQGLAEIL